MVTILSLLSFSCPDYMLLKSHSILYETLDLIIGSFNPEEEGKKNASILYTRVLKVTRLY